MPSDNNQQPEYEYVVVGSGAGGGPLAANLAKAGHKVLLLETGGAEEPDEYKVPVLHAASTEDKRLRWWFFVRHYMDDQRQNRDWKSGREVDGVKTDGVLYRRAGTLGGCTAHNAMITVYPHNSDWDHIAELMDDPSWSSDNMRKYFEKLDNCQYRPVRRFFNKLFGWNPTRNGFHGWLPSSAPSPFLILRDRTLLKIILNSAVGALKELGNPLIRLKQSLKRLPHPNDWRNVKKNPEGIRFAPLAVKDGNRVSTREYIRQVQSEFPDNLSVKTSCLVTKVLFDKKKSGRQSSRRRRISCRRQPLPGLSRSRPRRKSGGTDQSLRQQRGDSVRWSLQHPSTAQAIWDRTRGGVETTRHQSAKGSSRSW